MHLRRQRTAYLVIAAIVLLIASNITGKLPLALCGAAVFVLLLADYAIHYNVWPKRTVWLPLVIAAGAISLLYWQLEAPLSFFSIPIMVFGLALDRLSKQFRH